MGVLQGMWKDNADGLYSRFLVTYLNPLYLPLGESASLIDVANHSKPLHVVHTRHASKLLHRVELQLVISITVAHCFAWLPTTVARTAITPRCRTSQALTYMQTT
jgi:hypothetical protein